MSKKGKLAVFRVDEAAGCCQMCGAAVLSPGDCEISWSDEKKQYRVAVRLARRICRPCGPKAVVLNPMKWLVTVAESSNCVCGQMLRLTDHRLVRKGDQYDIEATYVCDRCNAKARSKPGFVQRLLSQFWNSTKSIKIGPVSFEKTTAEPKK